MEFEVATEGPMAVHDVTDGVADAVDDGVDSGAVVVFVPHTTAGVVVNEAEPGLVDDFEAALRELVPDSPGYRHDEVDDNAAAHLRASLLGESVTIPVSSGRLALGTWQSVLLVECDGPRTRRLVVTATGT